MILGLSYQGSTGPEKHQIIFWFIGYHNSWVNWCILNVSVILPKLWYWQESTGFKINRPTTTSGILLNFLEWRLSVLFRTIYLVIDTVDHGKDSPLFHSNSRHYIEYPFHFLKIPERWLYLPPWFGINFVKNGNGSMHYYIDDIGTKL